MAPSPSLPQPSETFEGNDASSTSISIGMKTFVRGCTSMAAMVNPSMRRNSVLCIDHHTVTSDPILSQEAAPPTPSQRWGSRRPQRRVPGFSLRCKASLPPPSGSCTACDINARCSQATRPFACQCLPGFEGNGSYCLGVPPDPLFSWNP